MGRGTMMQDCGEEDDEAEPEVRHLTVKHNLAGISLINSVASNPVAGGEADITI